MTTNIEDRFIEWLRDAHAMEEQAERLFSGQASHIEHYPEIKLQYERQAVLAKQHAELLRQRLDALGSSASVIKSIGAKILASFQNASGNFVGDEIVKSLLVSYTFVHMKIGSYRILLTTSELAGDTETGGIFNRLLEDELQMEQWVSDHIDQTTLQHLLRQEWDRDSAKH